TFLGGSGFYGSRAQAIAVDASGNAYITGSGGSEFPMVNAIQPAPANASSNPIVAKLNATGSALVYSTYLGGSAGDVAYGIAVDSSGNAYVAGYTQSADFPTFNAFQPSLKQHTCTNPSTGETYQCGEDAFVAELNATGDALYYSSFLGGSGNDFAYGIRVDSSGNAYVAGTTDSTDFPTANAYQATLAGQQDAFITKISAASGPAGIPFRILSFTPTTGPVGTSVTIT